MKTAVVCGAGGFIGHHMVNRLKSEGYWVMGIDLKPPQFEETKADHFVVGDLRDIGLCRTLFQESFDEVYQFAARMGGAGFVFVGDNDASIMHSSAQINLNIAEACTRCKVKKVFYSSSACIYPKHNQLDPNNPKCSEDSAYPADPDSPYGLEKLFSERLYEAYHRNYDLNVRIARFHNIFGTRGSWNDGCEKAPAALCRKIAQAKNGDTIEVWGSGQQTRSFLYIDECIDGVRRLMTSDYTEPINIGSEEMVSINQLTNMIVGIACKSIKIKNIPGPEGVKGRNSDNRLIEKVLGWKPSKPLIEGLKITYKWIEEQVKNENNTD